MHGGGDVEAVVVAETADRVEAANHLLGVLHGGVVVLHPGDIDEAAIVPELEAVDLLVGGLVEVFLGHAGDFTDPAVLGLGGFVLGGFDQIEGGIDELTMLAKAEILEVGEADIGMGVIDDVEGFDWLHAELR